MDRLELPHNKARLLNISTLDISRLNYYIERTYIALVEGDMIEFYNLLHESFAILNTKEVIKVESEQEFVDWFTYYSIRARTMSDKYRELGIRYYAHELSHQNVARAMGVECNIYFVHYSDGSPGGMVIIDPNILMQRFGYDQKSLMYFYYHLLLSPRDVDASPYEAETQLGLRLKECYEELLKQS